MHLPPRLCEQGGTGTAPPRSIVGNRLKIQGERLFTVVWYRTRIRGCSLGSRWWWCVCVGVENGKRYVLVLNNFFIFPVLSLFFRDVAVQNNCEDESRHQEPGREGAVSGIEGLPLPRLLSDRGQRHTLSLPQEQGRKVRASVKGKVVVLILKLVLSRYNPKKLRTAMGRYKNNGEQQREVAGGYYHYQQRGRPEVAAEGWVVLGHQPAGED